MSTARCCPCTYTVATDSTPLQLTRNQALLPSAQTTRGLPLTHRVSCDPSGRFEGVCCSSRRLLDWWLGFCRVPAGLECWYRAPIPYFIWNSRHEPHRTGNSLIVGFFIFWGGHTWKMETMYVLRTEQSSNVRKPSQAMTIQTNPLFHSLGGCSRSWRNESPRCGFDWFTAGLAKTIYRRITTVSQFYVVSTSHCPYHFRACVQHQAGSRMQSISNAVCCWVGPRSSVEPTSQNSRLYSFPDQGIVSLCRRFDLGGPQRDETTNESMGLTRESLKWQFEKMHPQLRWRIELVADS